MTAVCMIGDDSLRCNVLFVLLIIVGMSVSKFGLVLGKFVLSNKGGFRLNQAFTYFSPYLGSIKRGVFFSYRTYYSGNNKLLNCSAPLINKLDLDYVAVLVNWN